VGELAMERLKPLSELISLQGKRALITGSAAGIGRAMALRFAEAGCILQLVDIDLKKLEKLKSELSVLGSEVNIFQTDIASEEAIDSLWDKLSGIEPDILVNNAGIYPFKDFLKLDRKFLNKVMDINLYSVATMCQHMIAKRIRKGGIIINIGSIEAIMPLGQDLVPYSLSKMGVIALTRSLAKEYGKNGFRINAIVPGGIITSGTKAVAKRLAHLDTEIIKTGIEFKMRLPLNRAGKPDEVARIAIVLASDLSSYVNGALVPVDGGFLSS
jgi:NAD(P)-dependent dehydrogenase (short-subunit alcohol dehydrogenase family)